MSRLFKFKKEYLGVSAEQLLQNPGMNELDIFMSSLDTNGDTLHLVGHKILPYSIEEGTILYCSINRIITHRFEAIDGNGPKKINGETILSVRNIDKLPTPVKISNVPAISKGHSWPFLNIDQIAYIEEQQQHNMDIDASQDDADQGNESQGEASQGNALSANALSANAISANAISANAISVNEFQGNNTMLYMAERICFQLGIEDCSYIDIIFHAKVMLGIQHDPIFTNAQSNIRTKITHIYNQIA